MHTFSRSLKIKQIHKNSISQKIFLQQLIVEPDKINKELEWMKEGTGRKTIHTTSKKYILYKLLVKNKGEEKIKVFWVNERGQLISYSDLF